MKQILEQWKGKFEVDGEKVDSLKDIEFEDGEEFHIRLLKERKEKEKQ